MNEKPCSYCDGERYIKEKPKPGDHDYFKCEYRMTACRHCHGSGVEPPKEPWRKPEK